MARSLLRKDSRFSKKPARVQMKKNDKVARVSLAGEFAVLSQLALLGKDANMTLGNTKGVDILVSDPTTGRMLKLEVKTNFRNSRCSFVNSKTFGKFLSCSGWILKEKNGQYDESKDHNLFYCFVNIDKETNKYKYYVVPAKVVSDYVKEENRFFHEERVRQGKIVKHSDMRQFRLGIKGEKYNIVSTPIGEEYENNWDFKS